MVPAAQDWEEVGWLLQGLAGPGQHPEPVPVVQVLRLVLLQGLAGPGQHPEPELAYRQGQLDRLGLLLPETGLPPAEVSRPRTKPSASLHQ